jgi:hypothetical protein
MKKKDNSGVRNLKRVFSDTTSDVMTLDEIYKAAGVADINPQVRIMWIANRMKEFERYNLVEPINDTNFNLEKIRLTEEGKRVLGRIPEDSEKQMTGSHSKESMFIDKKDENIISLREVIDLFSGLSNNDQGSKFSIDIKLKEGIVSIHMT